YPELRCLHSQLTCSLRVRQRVQYLQVLSRRTRLHIFSMTGSFFVLDRAFLPLTLGVGDLFSRCVSHLRYAREDRTASLIRVVWPVIACGSESLLLRPVIYVLSSAWVSGLLSVVFTLSLRRILIPQSLAGSPPLLYQHLAQHYDNKTTYCMTNAQRLAHGLQLQ
ncbi:hypothetical protein BDR03DRAFT_947562, partial [Suillus americanus]